MQAPDLSGSRIDAMIDLNDPLAVPATRLPWHQIEASVAAKFERKERTGKFLAGHDMFGANKVLSGAGRSNAGRPKLPIRLRVSLLYRNHSFSLLELSTNEKHHQKRYGKHCARSPKDPALPVSARLAVADIDRIDVGASYLDVARTTTRGNWSLAAVTLPSWALASHALADRVVPEPQTDKRNHDQYDRHVFKVHRNALTTARGTFSPHRTVLAAPAPGSRAGRW